MTTPTNDTSSSCGRADRTVLRRRRHGSAHTGTPPATPHPKNVAALDPPDQPAPLDPPAVALTPRTVRLLFATADAVGSEDAAGEFYAALFARAPDLKQLFDDDGTKQRRKFADMMRWVTRALGGGLNGNEGGLSESLKALGRRHARYGVRLRHFHPVKAALLETIASLDYGGTEAAAVSPADVTRAWEGLVYVFVGEMGPVLRSDEPKMTPRRSLCFTSGLLSKARKCQHKPPDCLCDPRTQPVEGKASKSAEPPMDSSVDPFLFQNR